MTEEPEAYRDSRFTAEISNRMRVPDRIMVVGENQTRSPTFVGVNGPTAARHFGRDNNEKFEMQVPDRILVAGGDRHIAAKSTPFEMQVENAVMPPTRHEVRVNTPPRSIRLGEQNFPEPESRDSTDDENEDNILEDSHEISRPSSEQTPYKRGLVGKLITPRSASVESEALLHGRNASDPSMSMMNDTIHAGSGHSMNPWDEIQIVRRQIAKLNHRLMAVELENQQQQQREMILTVLVSCYFAGKFFMWLNRSP